MKIGILGTKFNTLDLLTNWDFDKINISTVVALETNENRLSEISGFATPEITNFCDKKNIPVSLAKSYNLRSHIDQKMMLDSGLDLLFVNGWERLLPSYLLENLSVGAFGMHGSAKGLPFGRGRSPLNWAIIQGYEFFATSLFRYDAGVDSGEIFGTKIFSIQPHDDIRTLHEKNLISMLSLINEFAELNFDQRLVVPQPKNGLSYYPKRKPSDGHLDFNLGANQIKNIVRALRKPYPGAFTVLDKVQYFINSCNTTGKELFQKTNQCGYVHFSSNDGKIIYAECADNIIRLEFDSSTPFSKGDCITSADTERNIVDITSRYHLGILDVEKEI